MKTMKDFAAKGRSLHGAKLRSFGAKGNLPDRVGDIEAACGGRAHRASGGRVHKADGGPLDLGDDHGPLDGHASRPQRNMKPRGPSNITINIGKSEPAPHPAMPPPPPPMPPPGPPPGAMMPPPGPMPPPGMGMPPPGMIPPGPPGMPMPMHAAGGRVGKYWGGGAGMASPFGGGNATPPIPVDPGGPHIPNLGPPPGSSVPNPPHPILNYGPPQGGAGMRPMAPPQPAPGLPVPNPPHPILNPAPASPPMQDWSGGGANRGGRQYADGGRAHKWPGGPMMGASPTAGLAPHKTVRALPAAVAAKIPPKPAMPMMPQGLPGPGAMPSGRRGLPPMMREGGGRAQHDGYDDNPKPRPKDPYNNMHSEVPVGKASGGSAQHDPGHVELDGGACSGPGRLQKNHREI